MTPNDKNPVKVWEFRDYLDLFFRRKLLILLTFAAIAVSTAVYQFSRPPIFGSVTTFTIDQSINSSGVGFDRYSPYAYWDMQRGKPLEYYQSIISSQIYVDQVLQRALLDSSLHSSTEELKETILEAIHSLALTQNEDSGLMSLAVRAGSPDVAFWVAVIATDVFKERNQQIELEGAQDVVKFIDKQRQAAQDRLEQAERELQQFDGAAEIYFVGQDGGMMSKVTQVEALIAESETQRRLAETNLASLEHQLSGNSKITAGLISTEEVPEIAATRRALANLEDQRHAMSLSATADTTARKRLEAQIESKKGDLRRQVMSHTAASLPSDDKRSEELRSVLTQRLVVEQINLSSLRNQERFYSNLREEYRRQSPQMLEKTIELARLKRTQTVHQNLLNYLVERHEEAKIKAATGAGSIRIINPAALPLQPIPRNIPRNLFLGLVLGLGFSFGLAFLLESLDQTVRTKEDLERLTGIQVVGLIPLHVQTNGRSQGMLKSRKAFSGVWKKVFKIHSRGKKTENEIYPLINQVNQVNVRTAFAESFRSLRTDLQFFRIDQPIKKLLITSSIPGEGKSLVTANLAIAHAELGYRVAILDADLRRPKQAAIFGVDRKPGMVEYLMDITSWESIIRPLNAPGLFLVPTGTLPPNPAEILNSQKMADVIDRLSHEFDYLFIDAPPLISLSDAKALSRLVEHLLLIFRYGSTEKRYVKEALGNLRNSNATIVGFALNGVDFGSGNGYGYGYGYYKYHYYYSSQPQEKMGKKVSITQPGVN